MSESEEPLFANPEEEAELRNKILAAFKANGGIKNIRRINELLDQRGANQSYLYNEEDDVIIGNHAA